MRKLLCLFFLLLVFESFAQRDLIITQAGSEIRCKLLSETTDRFTYAYINKSGKVSKTEIFKTLISTYKLDYFPADLLPEEKIFNKPAAISRLSASPSDSPQDLEEPKLKDRNSIDTGNNTEKKKLPKKRKEKKIKDPPATNNNHSYDTTAVSILAKDTSHVLLSKKSLSGNNQNGIIEQAIPESSKRKKSEFANYLKYRVGFTGGLANLIDKNQDKTPWGLYNEKLRRGWVYGVDAALFLNDYLGLGLIYTSYQSSNENKHFDFPNLQTGADYKIGSLKSLVQHKFVAPSLIGRLLLDYKTFIVASVSPGIFIYSNKGEENSMHYRFTGISPGAASHIGIDFLLGDNTYGRDIILSFECGYYYGSLKTLDYGSTVGKLNLAQPNSLNRLDFSVGLRFNRFPRYLR